MKRLHSLLLLLMSLCPMGAWAFPSQGQSGGEMNAEAVKGQELPPLPLDKKIRYGRLPNGLTYYIQHNEMPEHHAEFYIVQKVGSIQEEDNQRGLAHFLEHMAFNGTKHFPGNAMLEFLQRHGVKFGTNVNAYTSIDETVYNISDVPIDETAHPHIVDSCLLILRDWSGDISLESDEIDHERGVIHEEWRSRNNPGSRMYEHEILPKLLPGNRYGVRMPIGLMSVVDSFAYESLRNYYHKWYRPDLQGILVVGDVNVDEVEKTIKGLWSDMPAPVNPAKRERLAVANNDQPLVAVASDPEFAANILSILYKVEPMTAEQLRSSYGYTTNLIRSIVSSVINNRYMEMTEKADAPFLGAQSYFGHYLTARTKDAFETDVTFAEGEWQKALEATVSVLRSVSKFGVTAAEVERVKADVLSSFENAYNERDKRKNGSIVREMQRNFLNDEPMPGIEYEWQLAQQLMPLLTPELINSVTSTLITEDNVALYVMGKRQEKVPLPTESQLVEAYREAVSREAVAYEETVLDQPLIAHMPRSGSIKKSDEAAFGYTHWQLSNGVNVYYRLTDFKKDEVKMTAYSKGGSHLYKNEPLANLSCMDLLNGLGGLGAFSSTDLSKVLAGKQVYCSTSISERCETVDGWSTSRDMRTLFELIHLSMTNPRWDDEAYAAWYNRTETSLKTAEGTPWTVASDSLTQLLFPDNRLCRSLKLDSLKALDPKRTFALGKERFANAADFNFYFIGNIDVDSLRLFCNTYLASLPARKRGREKAAPAILPAPGSRECRFDLPLEEPKTSVYCFYNLYDQKWSLRDDLLLRVLSQAVTFRFTETIREREGGAYVPTVNASFNARTGFLQFYYAFETGAEKRARLEQIAEEELRRVVDEGITESEYLKIRDYMTKHYQEQVKENGYWLTAMVNWQEFGIDGVNGYLDILSSIKLDDVRDMAKRVIGGNRIVYVSNGVKAETKHP